MAHEDLEVRLKEALASSGVRLVAFTRHARLRAQVLLVLHDGRFVSVQARTSRHDDEATIEHRLLLSILSQATSTLHIEPPFSRDLLRALPAGTRLLLEDAESWVHVLWRGPRGAAVLEIARPSTRKRRTYLPDQASLDAWIVAHPGEPLDLEAPLEDVVARLLAEPR